LPRRASRGAALGLPFPPRDGEAFLAPELNDRDPADARAGLERAMPPERLTCLRGELDADDLISLRGAEPTPLLLDVFRDIALDSMRGFGRATLRV
jgi:hypothetical protein